MIYHINHNTSIYTRKQLADCYLTLFRMFRRYFSLLFSSRSSSRRADAFRFCGFFKLSTSAERVWISRSWKKRKTKHLTNLLNVWSGVTFTLCRVQSQNETKRCLAAGTWCNKDSDYKHWTLILHYNTSSDCVGWNVLKCILPIHLLLSFVFVLCFAPITTKWFT